MLAGLYSAGPFSESLHSTQSHIPVLMCQYCLCKRVVNFVSCPARSSVKKLGTNRQDMLLVIFREKICIRDTEENSSSQKPSYGLSVSRH